MRFKASESDLPQCRIRENPDENGGGFGAVPSAMARIQLVPKMRQLKDLFPQPQMQRMKFKGLGVCSPPMWNQQEHTWE